MRGHACQLSDDEQAQDQRQTIALPAWAPSAGEWFKGVLEGQRIHLLMPFDRRQDGAERVIVHTGLDLAFNEDSCLLIVARKNSFLILLWDF
jgi:hypothetical protein